MMNAADDFISKNEICSPLIGIYTSDAVDTSIGRNRLNFADLLIPFSTTQISIKVGLNMSTSVFPNNSSNSCINMSFRIHLGS